MVLDKLIKNSKEFTLGLIDGVRDSFYVPTQMRKLSDLDEKKDYGISEYSFLSRASGLLMGIYSGLYGLPLYFQTERIDDLILSGNPLILFSGAFAVSNLASLAYEAIRQGPPTKSLEVWAQQQDFERMMDKNFGRGWRKNAVSTIGTEEKLE